jgi:hypothetical protein
MPRVGASAISLMSSAVGLWPPMVADLGEAAALRFIDFFTANIRNPNTRAAYAVAVRGFAQRSLLIRCGKQRASCAVTRT